MWGFKSSQIRWISCWWVYEEKAWTHMLSCWSMDPILRVHSLTLDYQGTSRHPQTLPKTTRSQIPNEFHPATPNKGHYMTPTQTMHCYEGDPSKWVPFNDPCPTKWHLASRPEQDFLLKLPIRHDPCKECYLKCFIPPWSKSNLYTISMANLPNKALTWSQAANCLQKTREISLLPQNNNTNAASVWKPSNNVRSAKDCILRQLLEPWKCLRHFFSTRGRCEQQITISYVVIVIYNVWCIHTSMCM